MNSNIEIEDDLYNNKVVEKKFIIGRFFIIFTIIFIILLFLIYILNIFNIITFNIFNLIETSLLASILPIFDFILNSGYFSQNIIVESPLYFSKEQFEKKFEKIINKTPYKKLVFIIDNSDRCSSNTAYQLLSDVKTFLGEYEKNLIFIIPVDNNVLHEHIKNVSDSDNANEFLKKIFNLQINIKDVHNDDMYEFTDYLNKKYSLGYDNETINLISSENVNPRKIIQTLNNLNIELKNFISEGYDFIQKYETAICYFLILKEKFPDYYNNLVKNPEEFYKFEDDKFVEGNENLKDFIKGKIGFTRKLEENVIGKILTFSDKNKYGIPDKIIKSLENYDVQFIDDFLSKNEKKRDKLIDSLMSELKKQIKRNSFPYFKNIINLYIYLVKEYDAPLGLKMDNFQYAGDNIQPNSKNILFTNINEIENFIWLIKNKNPSHPLIKKLKEYLNYAAENAEDSDVRRIAVHEISDDKTLNIIARNDEDSSVKIAAVNRITDNELLGFIVENEEDSSVKIAAVNRITDNELLTNISKNDEDSSVRLAAEIKIKNNNFAAIVKNAEDPNIKKEAINNISDNDLLVDIAKNDDDSCVSIAAVNKIRDINSLISIVENAEDPYVRITAVNKIDDTKLLTSIAKNDEDPNVRITALYNIDDNNSLISIAKNDEDSNVRKIANKKLENCVNVIDAVSIY